MEKRVEELITSITASTGLSEQEIRDKIVKKQRDLSGLVSEEGAAYIVANELGVKTRNRVIESTVTITEIQPDMRNVTVVGRVRNITGPREFTTKTGNRGKVANLEIADSSGNTRVALWNMGDIEKVEKNELKIGDIIQIKNGYAKGGYYGGVELNLGNRGVLVLNPEGVEASEFPEAPESGEIALKDVKPNEAVSVIGRVTHNFGVNAFDKNGRQGQVANLIINDGTGTAKLVLWNEQADLAKTAEIGDIVKITNGYTKEGLRGVEVQANTRTQIEKNPEGVTLPEAGAMTSSERAKISELQEGDAFKEIRGALVNVYGDNFVFDLCPTCNKKAEGGNCPNCGVVTPKKLFVVNTMVDDGTGTIRASFFRDAAEKAFELSTDEVAADPIAAKAKMESKLGKELVLDGRVKQNAQMDRLEFNVVQVKEASAADEANQLLNQIQQEVTK